MRRYPSNAPAASMFTRTGAPGSAGSSVLRQKDSGASPAPRIGAESGRAGVRRSSAAVEGSSEGHLHVRRAGHVLNAQTPPTPPHPTPPAPLHPTQAEREAPKPDPLQQRVGCVLPCPTAATLACPITATQAEPQGAKGDSPAAPVVRSAEGGTASKGADWEAANSLACDTHLDERHGGDELGQDKQHLRAAGSVLIPA